MSRMRTSGLIVFTFFALLMLALTAGGLVEAVHAGRHWPLMEIMSGLVLVLAMTVGAAGLWFRWAARNMRGRHEDALPRAFTPRSKHAVWSGRPHSLPGLLTRRDGLRTRKTLRRKG